MSGLEGLAALGLACNIFQVISFGRETLGLVKSVYRDGTLDNSLMDKITALQGVTSDIIDVNIPQSGNQEKKLIDVTKKCTGVARDLQEEIAFLVGQNGQGSLRATLRIAAKANWRKRRLDRMEKALSDAEQLMQTNLLAWIFKSTNTANINIDSLGHEARNFVTKYENGCRQTSQLVSSEALHMREVVVRQTGKTEEAIRAHVTQTSENLERNFENRIEQGTRARLQEKLLGTLKYPGMNERANQVENAHARTFRWIFADEDNGSDRKAPEPVWSSFTDWLQSNLSVYWIMGKPGSGKSTLAKFILSEPRTRMSLEKWRTGAIIVRHYFWRPGALLQRSIKGMLCSVIYQLVLSIPNAMEYVSINVPELSIKDAHTDWSVADLQKLCLGLIEHFGKPLCVFIDGLDECGPEDTHQKLLETLERIKLPNVKIIALSRNEPIFEKRFRHEPQLCMQDLTAGDLRIYALESLPEEYKHQLCDELVHNAEGVFLWLVLAIQSINRGWSNGDSLEDLRVRIRSLPKGLNDLYKDMWERLNDDSDLYRESAALYFKLKMFADDGVLKLECLKGGWCILEMMLASFAKNRWPLTERPLISASELVKECAEFQERVQVRCAGLLVLNRRSPSTSLEKGLQDTESALHEYTDTTVGFRFIHRSAKDFLVETIGGQNILKHGGLSRNAINIRIVSGSLWAAGLLRLMLGKTMGYLPKGLKLYLDDLSSIANANVRHSDMCDLVSLCYQLYISSDLISIHWDERPTRAAAFFGDAACYPKLRRYFFCIIKRQLVGSGIRSAALSSVVRNLQGDFALQLIARFMKLPNVDVNLKCPLLVLTESKACCTIDDMRPLDCVKASPFTRLLGFGLEHLVWGPYRYDESTTQFLRLVSDFASHGADFRSKVLVAFPLDYVSSSVFGSLRLLQIPGMNLSSWSELECNDNKVLCVEALQATNVIQRMLASFLRTGPGYDSADEGHLSADESHYSTDEDGYSTDEDGYSTNEDGHGSEEDEYSAADFDKALSFLSQRCQESGSGADDRVIGFIHGCDDFADMPYRQVSEQDSASLMEMIWQSVFEGASQDLGLRCREVIARSPFSAIGFRDYARDMGYFDGLAAHKLLLEYQQEDEYLKIYHLDTQQARWNKIWVDWDEGLSW